MFIISLFLSYKKNENQRKKVRKNTGVIEKGGAFHCLSAFCGHA